MSDEFTPAITALQRKLDEQLLAVADTKRSINLLMKMSGQSPVFPEHDEERSGSVRADQFYGKPLAPSAAEYLTMRKQACQPDEIYRALKAGGFDFVLQGWRGDERDMVRNLAMSLSKNTGERGKFHRLKNGSFGLRSWYDETFLKKAGDGPLKAKQKTTNGKKTSKAKPKAKASGKAPAPQPQMKKTQPKTSAPNAGSKKPEIVKQKNSANDKSRSAADHTTQKEVAS